MKQRRISLQHDFAPYVDVPEQNILAILAPKILESEGGKDNIIEDAIYNPIGSVGISEAVSSSDSVLILIDDNTRKTPVHKILPLVINELQTAGVPKKQIRIMVATGTHRSMTIEEKIKKCGAAIVEEYDVLDHEWNNPDELVHLGHTTGGIEVELNRAVVDTDYLIGIGQIVPHRVPGFSGGAKIVQPGVCGKRTTGETHWLSAEYDGDQILGVVENPVREAIEEVGRMAGLSFIVNTIQDGDGAVCYCVAGDPYMAFRVGAEYSRKVYSALLPHAADIVIVESYPADLELWQAAKGIFNGDVALRKDGIMILVSPCTEGVAVSHPAIEQIGYLSHEETNKLLSSGSLQDLTVAAHISHVGRVIRGKREAFIISRGITSEIAKKLGFTPYKDVNDALAQALNRKGEDASVVVIKKGGEVLPVIGGK